MNSHTGINEQTGVWSSLEWDDISRHHSAQDFWNYILETKTFVGNEHRIASYKGICELREIDTVEFLEKYEGLVNPLPSALVTEARSGVQSALVCRDEENLKEWVWSSTHKYWRLVWSRERNT